MNQNIQRAIVAKFEAEHALVAANRLSDVKALPPVWRTRIPE